MNIAVRTALLINTTSRFLTRDTPIKPTESCSESRSRQTSDVATTTLRSLSKPDHQVASEERGQPKLHYYKQLDETNRRRRELSGAFRAKL